MGWVPLAGIAVGFGLLVIVPVVAILTEHQRKMARILHGQADGSDRELEIVVGAKVSPQKEILDELRNLRADVNALKERVDSVTHERGLAEAELRQHLSQ